MGRIGRIHLENLTHRIKGAEVAAVVNPSQQGQDYALDYGVPQVSDRADIIFGDPSIDAVLVGSPTSSHADYVVRAAEAGKAIFCEKPIDLSLQRAKAVVEQVEAHQVPLMIAFNRRFDPDLFKIHTAIAHGDVGEVHSLHIISRDPGPPPIPYIKESGGLFKDMTIHDFDMARYIMGCEVLEVFATGSCRIDHQIKEAGDIDTAMILLRFENGATAVIENSRKAVYGYDQRLEVFGSKGMMKMENPYRTQVYFSGEQGTASDANLNFFMDRYQTSYLLEMQAFVDALLINGPMPVDGKDGIKAMALAEAAYASLRDNRPIKVLD